MNVHPTKLILDVCYQKQILEFFYFQLETLLNKLVKLCSSFFQKNYFEQKCRVFSFHQKNQPILKQALQCIFTKINWLDEIPHS